MFPILSAHRLSKWKLSVTRDQLTDAPRAKPTSELHDLSAFHIILVTLRIPHVLAVSVIHFKRLKIIVSNTFDIFSVDVFSDNILYCNTGHCRHFSSVLIPQHDGWLIIPVILVIIISVLSRGILLGSRILSRYQKERKHLGFRVVFSMGREQEMPYQSH